MPFEAAKAVSATFCWKIRYALTPIFGLDFPSMCIHPRDRALYGRMTIDPAIIDKATETANLYRMLELRRTPVSVQSDPPRSSPYAARHPFSRRHASSSLSNSTSTVSSSPEYVEAFCASPISDYRNAFTPVNTPRSSDVRSIQTTMSMRPGMGMSPQPRIPPSHPRSVTSFSEKIHPDQSETDSYSSSSASLYSDPDLASESDSSSSSLDLNDCAVDSQTSSPRLARPRPPVRSRPGRFAREVKAAHALLSLYMQDATSDMEQKTKTSKTLAQGRKRRRASA